MISITSLKQCHYLGAGSSKKNGCSIVRSSGGRGVVLAREIYVISRKHLASAAATYLMISQYSDGQQLAQSVSL